MPVSGLEPPTFQVINLKVTCARTFESRYRALLITKPPVRGPNVKNDDLRQCVLVGPTQELRGGCISPEPTTQAPQADRRRPPHLIAWCTPNEQDVAEDMRKRPLYLVSSEVNVDSLCPGD